MQRNNLSDEKWAIDFRKEVIKRKLLLESEIVKREQELSKLIPGQLRVMKHRNGYQYFERKGSDDRKGTYISKSRMNRAWEIAQSDYDKQFVREAKAELALLDKYLTKIEEGNIDKLFSSLSPGRQSLITPVLTPPDSMREIWNSEEYASGRFDSEAPVHITANGERVRSKSEVAIANALKEHGVPYHYEYPLFINGIEYRPDFTCINLRSRRIYVWEHFGIMDDPEYARSSIEKIYKYEANGYIPGKNYIMTFETSRLPLNSITIKRRIQDFLI